MEIIVSIKIDFMQQFKIICLRNHGFTEIIVTSVNSTACLKKMVLSIILFANAITK